MLIGEYRHSIDTKKRLALPVKFRKELGGEVVITKGFESCLVVYTEKEWQVMAEKLSRLPNSQIEARGYARIVLGGAMQVAIDALGRILVPEYLKQYAGLKKNIVICGLSNRLEIWDEASWNSYRQKTEKEVENLASKLGGAGI